MQGRNSTRIKFPFWNYSGLQLIRRLTVDQITNQCCGVRAKRGGYSISSEGSSKGPQGEPTLPTYGQTLSTVTDAKHQNIPPDLGKNSDTKIREHGMRNEDEV